MSSRCTTYVYVFLGSTQLIHNGKRWDILGNTSFLYRRNSSSAFLTFWGNEVTNRMVLGGSPFNKIRVLVFFTSSINGMCLILGPSFYSSTLENISYGSSHSLEIIVAIFGCLEMEKLWSSWGTLSSWSTLGVGIGSQELVGLFMHNRSKKFLETF